MRKIKRKSGGIYERKVLSEEWKEWRNVMAYINKWRTKYYEVRKELAKSSRKGWLKASYWDTKKQKMVYYKDIMTYVQFIDMRMANKKEFQKFYAELEKIKLKYK